MRCKRLMSYVFMPWSGFHNVHKIHNTVLSVVTEDAYGSFKQAWKVAGSGRQEVFSSREVCVDEESGSRTDPVTGA